MRTHLKNTETGPATRLNTITDGNSATTYQDLPGQLTHVDTQLASQGIGPHSCVAVECANTLPAALLLLALFRNRNSFVLAPPVLPGQDLKPTPNFCSHRIALSTGPLQAEPNPAFHGNPPPPGRLFLRTSGSMGASKLVVHRHEMVLGNARNCVEKYRFRPESRVVIPVPIAHMYGFGAVFLPAILTGASINLQEKTNILLYLDREKRFQPTIAFVTPSLCEMLLKGYRSPRTNYDVMVTSGQRIPEDRFRALDAFLNGRLINQYGSTEMGATAACSPGESLEKRATSIGSPMAGVALKVDPATGALLCRHPYSFEGYVDENGAWLQQHSPSEWYATGDKAVAGPEDSLVVTGRIDAGINRSGYLVMLSDIERLMETLPEVTEVAVVAGKTEGKQGLRIGAFCVLRPGAPLAAADLRARCFGLLPAYGIPDEVRILESLPLLPAGKVDRQTLAATLD